MNRRKFAVFVAFSFALVLVLSGRPQTRAQGAETESPSVAQLDPCLIADAASDLASRPSPHTPRCCVGSHG
jgi:hypothetical protein